MKNKKKDVKNEEIKTNKFITFVKSHVLLSVLIGVGALLLIGGSSVFAYVMYKNNQNYCLVQFETNGGSSIEAQEIKCGTIPKKPQNPTKEGFDFRYWTYNGKKYDFKKPILESIVLNSIYEVQEGVEIVTINFDTGGGSKIAPIQLKKGELLNKPVDPTLSGYKFNGWYKDYIEFDFSSPITEDIVLKAKWGESNNKEENIKVVQSVGQYECQASFRSDIPEREVELGYVDHVNWTWSTYGILTGDNKCYERFSSSDYNIASVNDNGIITTNNTGIAYIKNCVYDTATNNEVICFTGKLIVKPDESVPYNDDEIWLINLRADDYTMEVGTTQKLRMEIEPKNYKETTFEWSSSDDSIVKVIDKKNGKIKAIKEGNAWIIVKSGNGVEGGCPITVIKRVTDISISPSTLELHTKDVSNLTVNYTPSDATRKDVSWVSSNPDIVYIDTFGKIIAMSKGKATITATTIDGSNKSATCEVTVKDINVSGLSLNKDSMEIIKRRSGSLKANITPENATNKKVFWSSSNPNVAKVNDYGSVTGVSPGTAVITATTEDGNKTASCTVTVKDDKLLSITFSDPYYNIVLGESQHLDIIFNPDYAYNKNLTWESSNPEVAIVSAGNIFTKKRGSTVITATAEDGGLTAQVAVYVVNPPLSATANFFTETVAGEEGAIIKKIGVKVQGAGGAPVYNYSIKLYKDGILVVNTSNHSINTIRVDDDGQGSYTCEYTVTDTNGDSVSGSIGPESF